jgi:molecular chaperone GrpE
MIKRNPIEEMKDSEAPEPAADGESVSPESAALPVDLGAELEQARAQAKEWQDKYLRKLAEFDNFRKRTRQEQEMLREIVVENVVAGLLPVMDDFDRMLSAPGNSDDPLRKGVELIRDKLRAFFESYDVKKIECVGKPFNHDEHDALMTQPTPGFPAGTVLAVIAPGYRMGERVIRHAQVVVSSEPETEEDSGSD